MQSDHTTEGAVKAILDEMEDKLLLAMQSDKGTEMCAFQWLPNSRVIHFSPVRMATSNVQWWNASSRPCRARCITTWWPTGRNISRMYCWPCCTPTMPPITALSTWCPGQWTGRSGMGSACTCHDACGTWQASELPYPGTGWGWANPGVS